ncbi:hypothetical protein [Heyndrickxia coagulans]|uniref:hypothetical protein n=1 Tax=Heyndrickxia coagulans TaxID=1398 RepID=UPI000779E530|nr:hypothetical protein [Heyndrickxia coagulans]KYC67167.1 hypothetical protein B4100_3803 [Heyndrickxia coagulans]
MDKRLNIEGSPASKMVQLIRKHGYNRGIGLELGTITAPPPSISVKLSDGIELDADDIILTKTALDAGLLSGATVLIASDEDGQTYYVIDKVVT